ncbi:MAG: hypothetical protein ACPL3C_11585 [Pyrobaculum sp.]
MRARKVHYDVEYGPRPADLVYDWDFAEVAVANLENKIFMDEFMHTLRMWRSKGCIEGVNAGSYRAEGCGQRNKREQCGDVMIPTRLIGVERDMVLSVSKLRKPLEMCTPGSLFRVATVVVL